MLNTQFRGNRPNGSGEEEFWRVFTKYGRGGHLGHVTWTIFTNFRSPFPTRLHIKFGFDWPSGFRWDDLWKWWTDGRTPTDDGRTRAWWVHYKLTLWALRLRWDKHCLHQLRKLITRQVLTGCGMPRWNILIHSQRYAMLRFSSYLCALIRT